MSGEHQILIWAWHWWRWNLWSPVVRVPVVVVIKDPLDPSLVAALCGAQELGGRGHQVIAPDGGQRSASEAGGARGEARARGQGRVDHGAQGACNMVVIIIIRKN